MNPHQDSSIALHTFPIGLVKNAWHKTGSIWNEKLFSIRMELASSLDGSNGSREDAECFISYKNRIEYTLRG
jgi:hypothetical protein